MTTEAHGLGLILGVAIIAALLSSLVLRAFRSRFVSAARLGASLLANVAVAIFTGREAFRAFARGDVCFSALGVVLALVALSATALAAVFSWALARHLGAPDGDEPAS